jgi:hypothetical protein
MFVVDLRKKGTRTDFPKSMLVPRHVRASADGLIPQITMTPPSGRKMRLRFPINLADNKEVGKAMVQALNAMLSATP